MLSWASAEIASAEISRELVQMSRWEEWNFIIRLALPAVPVIAPVLMVVLVGLVTESLRASLGWGLVVLLWPGVVALAGVGWGVELILMVLSWLGVSILALSTVLALFANPWRSA